MSGALGRTELGRGFTLEADDASAFELDQPFARLADVAVALAWSVLLVMCWVQFSAAWLYPPSRFGGVRALILEKPHAVPFQYLLWLFIVVATLLHLRSAGIDRLARVLGPFVPFALAGGVAALLGYAPLASIRLLLLWTLMAFGAACIGLQLGPRRSTVALGWAMLLTLAASIVMALAVPRLGTQLYGGDSVWRGVFTTKNQFGWIAALCLVVGWSLRSVLGRLLATLLCASALLCLVASFSKGALLAALAALMFGVVVRRLARIVSPGLGFALLTVGLAALAAGLGFALPLLLDLLGRDATLTGRTEIWSGFFKMMLATPWFGEGPGAYTSLSPLTLKLAGRFESLGGILSPHNYFLGAFGDAGLFGLLGAVGVLVYLSFVVPLRRWTVYSASCAAVGIAIAVHGMVETHEVFSAGAGAFLLILLRACGVADAVAEASAAELTPLDEAAIDASATTASAPDESTASPVPEREFDRPGSAR